MKEKTPVKSNPSLSSGGLDQILRDVSDIEKQLLELDLNESDHENEVDIPMEESSQEVKNISEKEEKEQKQEELEGRLNDF